MNKGMWAASSSWDNLQPSTSKEIGIQSYKRMELNPGSDLINQIHPLSLQKEACHF